jgi:hypothetical protein
VYGSNSSQFTGTFQVLLVPLNSPSQAKFSPECQKCPAVFQIKKCYIADSGYTAAKQPSASQYRYFNLSRLYIQQQNSHQPANTDILTLADCIYSSRTAISQPIQIF